MVESEKRFFQKNLKMMRVIALIMILLGLYFGYRSYIFTQNAIYTTATIVDFVEREDEEDGTISYAPVFIFKDMQGNSYKVVSNTSSNPPVGEVGDEIEILYDPRDPQNAEQNSFFSIWGLSAILIGIALSILLIFESLNIAIKKGKVNLKYSKYNEYDWDFD